MIKYKSQEALLYGKRKESSTWNTYDYRKGYKIKQVNSKYGNMQIKVPQDCKSTFAPQAVKKCKKDISDIDQKIILVYAKEMTIR